MIVGKEDVDPYDAPTLHYVRPRPPRVLSSRCFTGISSTGLYLAEVSSPIFELLRERKRAEERKCAVFLQVFFSSYYLSLCIVGCIYTCY